MNNIHKARLYYLGFFAIGFALATSLILYALKQNINVFVTPTQMISGNFPADYHFRLGGLVKKKSVIHDKENIGVTFVVTDLHHEVLVHYRGILPDLFREGKGVIAFGNKNAQGVFVATEVLAKHDENYMPRDVYKAIREKNNA